MPIGFTLPFARNTDALGALDFSTTELEAAKYNILSLLVTNWGERPNHYYLGCNLTEYLFNPIGEETKRAVVDRVQSQISTWIPYVEVRSVHVDVQENTLAVSIDFNLKNRPDLRSVVATEIG